MTNQSISQRPLAASVKDSDLFLFSEKQANGTYVSKSVKAEAVAGKSAYTTWIENKTTIEQYIDNKTINQFFEESNITTIQEFFNTYQVTQAYNTWVDNRTYHNYEYLNEYIVTNNLTQQFNEYKQGTSEADVIKLMTEFIKSLNLTNDYQQVVNNYNIDTSQNTYVNEEYVTEIYNNYVTTHPSVSLEDFLNLSGSLEVYKEWVLEKFKEFDEKEFLQDLKGNSGVGSVLNKYTEIWLSASTVYEEPAEVVPPAVAKEPSLLFGLTIIPEKSFITFDRTHQFFSSEEDVEVILEGKFIKMSLDKPDELLISFTINSNGTFTPAFEADDMLFLDVGTVIKISFKNKPVDQTAVALSLIAKKLRSYASSASGLLFRGSWSVTDSLIGPALSPFSGDRSTPLVSDKFTFFFDSWNGNDSSFSKVFSTTIKSTDEGEIVNVFNVSRNNRTLTFNPVGNGRLLNNVKLLPPNVTVKPDGAVVLQLSALEV